MAVRRQSEMVGDGRCLRIPLKLWFLIHHNTEPTVKTTFELLCVL
jgi:hypothetical protein